MILAGKFFLVLFSFVTLITLMRWSSRPDLPRRTHDLAMLSLVVLTRMGLFITIFLLLGIEPRSDVTLYYQEAVEALHGKIPLVGVYTPYGPLFIEIAAIVIFFWNSPAALVFAAVLIEIISFPVWLQVGRKAFTEMQTRRAAAFYAVNPLVISNVVIAGQNQVWISLLLALSLLALLKEREGRSGICLGFSIVGVKYLALLFAPVLFLAARRRVVWAMSFLVFPIAVYATVMLLGAQPLNQVIERAYIGFPGNIPFLFGAGGFTLTNTNGRMIADILAFCVLCGAFLAAIRRFGLPDAPRVVLLCAFVLVVTLVASPMGSANYLTIAVFPLCFMIASQEHLLLAGFGFLGICGLATLEPSLWFRWMNERGLENVTRLHLTVFFFCDLLLVGGYVWLLAMTWRAMKGAETGQGAEMTGSRVIDRLRGGG